MDYQKIERLDTALVAASKNIKVLSTLTWPAESEALFLKTWQKGKPQLPKIKIQPPNVKDYVLDLEAIAKQCDLKDPVEKYLAETAQSYANAGHMLLNVGTAEFTKYSTRIYGRPDTVYKLQNISGVDGAKFFLDVTDRLLGTQRIQTPEAEISATAFAAAIKPTIDDFFTQDTVNIVLDPNLSSKAVAGATRVRIREGALFSQLDKDQLIHHEAFVHSATQLNGNKQLNLKSLGLGAPRTTRTQEGIAVMAELITNSIDISRLRRIALRVIAIQMALDGADFIEVFKFFLDGGQTEVESLRSAQRVFRGGAVKGGVVFTKDSVYLKGLFEVHTFLRVAIRDNRPELVSNLFAGRLTLADALRLDPLFQAGWLQPPTYMPSWASNLSRLAATMAYSAFITNIQIDKVYLERAIEIEDELAAFQ